MKKKTNWLLILAFAFLAIGAWLAVIESVR
jgi:hypothetical protein